PTRDQRAAPAPLRGEQRLPRPSQPARHDLFRPFARRPLRRNPRAQRSPVVYRVPIPSGTQVPPQPPAPLVSGVCQGRVGTSKQGEKGALREVASGLDRAMVVESGQKL